MIHKQKLEELYWQACQGKDRTYDGQFVLAVRTTGIYCRPSCPSRSPKRENVVFFCLPGLAKAAGFRACKRCQPNGPALTEEYAAKMAIACRALETEEKAPSLDELAKGAGMSRFHFHRD
jgi:AraC family transcriptional regulator of adaptative response/methylated-DNA-[protein]-cysteine methyltransferase